MNWRQFLETTRAYLANEEPRDMAQHQPHQFPFTNSTDCTLPFMRTPMRPSCPQAEETPHTCPECGRAMKLCCYCEIGKVVESAPGPEVQS